MPSPIYSAQYPPLDEAFRDSSERGWTVLGRPVPDLSALPASEAEDWRRAIGDYARSCGCALGAAVGLTAAIGYTAAVVTLGGIGGFWASLGIGAVTFIIASGAGKTLGLARTRRQLDRVLMMAARRVLEARGPIGEITTERGPHARGE